MGLGAAYGMLGLSYMVPAWLLVGSAASMGGESLDRRAQVFKVVRRQRQFWQVFALIVVFMTTVYPLALIGVAVSAQGVTDDLRAIEDELGA